LLGRANADDVSIAAEALIANINVIGAMGEVIACPNANPDILDTDRVYA
jgi:hypothetical protein